MDALRAIIAKQKEQVTALPRAGPGRYFRQGDVEAEQRKEKEKEEKEKAEKRKREELERLRDLEERLKAKKFRRAEDQPAQTEREPGPPPTGDAEEQEPPFPLAEVYRRLRKLKQPITLFGETPWKRYCRLCALELQVLDDEMPEGQQNVFNAMAREGEEEDEFEEVTKPHATPSGDSASEPAKSQQGGAQRTPETRTKEQTIIEWTRRMLSLWEEELKQRSEEERATPEGRQQTALHRQTKKDLKPLLKRLKNRQLETDICDRLHEIVQLCEERRYRDAHGSFMLLAIGNAAWPMGVTMVGIHERAGRSKLNTSQVAHILNDETTRKYIQMFKRLMSFCQRKFKAAPSQTILMSVHHV